MNEILAAALGGAIGGGLGGLLGAGWDKIAKPSDGKRSKVAAVLAIGLGLIGARVASDRLRPSLEEQADRSNPALAAMHKYYPVDYANMMSALRAQSPNSSPAQIHATMLPYVTALVSRHAKELDENGARNSIALLVDEARLLQTKSPKSCVASMYGKPLDVDVASIMTPEMKKRDLANTAAVLTQAATHPAPPARPLSAQQLAGLTASALGKLPSDQRVMLAPLMGTGKSPQTNAEMGAMCGFEINFYSAILVGPAGTARAALATD